MRLEHDYHWLVLVLHHIVADGWSFKVLHRDLRALYEARRRHEQAALSHFLSSMRTLPAGNGVSCKGSDWMPCLPIGRRN
ncbi:MAG: hypothetical protein ABS69_09505 [Nitrosomonadales bacterium SCN 54-20]|nr:MAG: hypothetical protein ABS69_09505 [Nitrosomonadales bacterium SCN 54-20]